MVIFEDYFVNNRTGWPVSGDCSGDCRIQDGKYTIAVSDDYCTAVWVDTKFDWRGAFEVRAVVENESGDDESEYGLLWGLRRPEDASHDPQTDGYAFLVSGNGSYGIFRHTHEAEAGPPIQDWTPAKCVRRGNSVNTISVMGIGVQVLFYINNDFVTAKPWSTRMKCGACVGFRVWGEMRMSAHSLVVIADVE